MGENSANNIVANADFFVAKVVCIIRIVRVVVWLAGYHGVSRRWLHFHGLFSLSKFRRV